MNHLPRWLRTAAVVFAVVTACAQPSHADGEMLTIRRAEPPSWWVGLPADQVQVMVYGEDIARTEPALVPSEVPATPRCRARDGDTPVSVEDPMASNACVKPAPAPDAEVLLTDVQRTENPNYLFLTLNIGANAPPQTLQIDFERDGEVAGQLLYPLLMRDPARIDAPGFAPSDVMYLITPDRFANGDPDNDSVPGLEDRLNREDHYGRHGGDLAGIRARLDYIADMGFSQIWLNPVLENAQPRWSYHGYAITDHYRIDPRFGRNSDYQALADAARARGIGLVIDIVLNHIGHQHWWMADLPGSDWVHHGEFVGTSHQRESLQDPYVAASDVRRFADGWFVPTMPDLNQRQPLLANYLIQHSIWWVEYAGLSGIRVDTWPYSHKPFLTEYARRLRETFPRLNIVGEEWTTNPSIIAYWQEGALRRDDHVSYLPSLMDFPLQDALVRGLKEPESWAEGLVRLYRVLASDFVYGDPMQLMTFPDNHDMSRIYTQLDEDIDLWKQAHVVLLTTRGIPHLYYGSELLFANPGTDSHGVIRREFTGGWPDHDADAVTGEGLTPEVRDAQQWLRRLLRWRRSAPAIHTGTLVHYAPNDGVYAYRRTDTNSGHSVVVAINKTEETVSLDPARYPELFEDLPAPAGTDVLSGDSLNARGPVTVPPRGARVIDFRPALTPDTSLQ